MTIFQYDAAIINHYPNIVGGVILASGMRNGPSSHELQAAFAAEQQAVLERIGDTPLSELPSIAAWRRAFSQFGVKPTQYRSACEALLRRLTKRGDIPSINTLVDIGNLVSIRYALPVAVFDMQAVQGGVTVKFARGSERFTELGTDEIIRPEPGEVIFSDQADMVIARRWCWRQSAESAAQATTTNAIITFEAQHEGGHEAVSQAGADLLQLLEAYAGGAFSQVVLDKDQPRV